MICSNSLKKEETRTEEEEDIHGLINMTFYYFERIFRGSEGNVWCRQIRYCARINLLTCCQPRGLHHRPLLVLPSSWQCQYQGSVKITGCNWLCVYLFLVLFSKVSVAQTLQC